MTCVYVWCVIYPLETASLLEMSHLYLLSWRRLGFFFTCGCVGSVLQVEVCYNIFIYTLTIHMGPSTSDSRQTTNYFLHNINNSLTNHNLFCPMALPGVLGCGRGALEWACQSMLYSLTSPLLSLCSTLSLFPFHAPNIYHGKHTRKTSACRHLQKNADA